LRPGVALGTATKMVGAQAAKILPASITTGSRGRRRRFSRRRRVCWRCWALRFS
jgi:hypothetical protein